jgi:DNA replication factor GINS
MNLDELQSVQARERQSSDLQHLRSSFYKEVGEYIKELNEERARVVEAAEDPFSEPEVRRLTDDIETAEGTVEAIYERRVGKVVKKASIAAAGMPIEDDGLTAEEEALFEDLVERIKSNRETVLSVLDGEAPTVSCSIEEETQSSGQSRPGNLQSSKEKASQPSVEPDPSAGSESSDGGVSAADLMGDGADTAAETMSAENDTGSPPVAATGEEQNGPEPTPPPTNSREPDGDPAPETGGSAATAVTEQNERSMPGIPRTTVRITSDIGEIVGADDRDYDLGNEDVVTLPSPNADVLVEKDAAERLE